MGTPAQVIKIRGNHPAAPAGLQLVQNEGNRLLAGNAVNG